MADIHWRQLPALSALRAFEATARLGGFSAAARALNVTPAAVTQQVRGLEKDLGVPLVRRDGRSVVLTPGGERLAVRLYEGFSTLAAGVEDLLATEKTRGLRVYTTTFIVDTMIMPRMNEFWMTHPGTEVAFTPGLCHSNITEQTFVEENYDVVIMSGSGSWPDVDVETLLECPLFVVGTPDLCRKAQDDPTQVPWIWNPGERFLPDTLRRLGIDPDRLQTVDVGNPRLEMAAARAGHGLTIATEVVARPDFKSGALQRLDPAAEVAAVYYVVTRKGPRRKPVADFVDWLHGIADDWVADGSQSVQPVLQAVPVSR